ncbi:hypothetical protein F511_09553 [Dorcoceras hygrometricum]|uniref:Uncharacterized protein n=1 Tax=Dorcoceras hygrometricum TaxID=472368 RepID=A0A2Z7CSN7_9LAMI|nr:hypothetical protein F511_09553 [Dorcoceras hygrometricum]
MPQVDLVSACARGGSDRKVVCETLADDETPAGNESIPDDEEEADFPPESFWLSKDAEYDWFDRNAFFERKDSTKGNANAVNLNPNSNHSSQRFSFTLKSKASIIGLPKTQKNTFADSSRRTCRSVNVRLFPKRPTSAVAIIDPGSPKVSCIGRVRSKRGRRRSTSSKRAEKPLEKSKTSREKPAEKQKLAVEKKKKQQNKKKKGGFYSKLMSVFRSKKNPDRSSSSKMVEEKPAALEPQWRSVSYKAASEPPSLGGMTRFASGRRSGSWAAGGFQSSGCGVAGIGPARVWHGPKRVNNRSIALRGCHNYL